EKERIGSRRWDTRRPRRTPPPRLRDPAARRRKPRGVRHARERREDSVCRRTRWGARPPPNPARRTRSGSGNPRPGGTDIPCHWRKSAPAPNAGSRWNWPEASPGIFRGALGTSKPAASRPENRARRRRSRPAARSRRRRKLFVPVETLRYLLATTFLKWNPRAPPAAARRREAIWDG